MAGDFSDEEWDISDDQLETLEHNAIASTQQQQQQQQQPPPSRNGPQIRNNSTNSGSTIRIDTPFQQKTVPNGVKNRQPPNVQQRNDDSFDNPALDEDGVPLVIEEQRNQTYVYPRRLDETAQREQWRQNRFAQKNGPAVHQPSAKSIPHRAYQSYQQQHQQYGRPIQQNQAHAIVKTPVATQLTPSSQTVNPQPANLPGASTTNLELERERREKTELQKQLESLTKELHTARGESAVIRNKTVESSKLADRQLSAVKRQLQEQVKKHQAELQSREQAYNQLTVDHNFVKHELDEQTRRIRTLQQQVKERSTRAPEFVPSPRKSLHNTLRDGFDDDEILQLSPARSPAKRKTSKPATPSKKRKHPGNGIDESVLTLRFSQPQDEIDISVADEPPKSEAVTKFVKDFETEEHLTLLQAVLNFRPLASQETLVECLVKLTYPSDSGRLMSSLLLFETSQLKGDRFSGDLLGIFTKFLVRCATEKYYKPVTVLLATIKLILDLEPTVIDAEAVQTLANPLQTLAGINPRGKWHLDKNVFLIDNKNQPKFEPDVDATECLDILVMIANLITDEPALIRLFWRCVETELVLLMLAPCQSISDLHLMLELLSTSIQPTTFGNICAPEQQAKMEEYILDKVCFLLWDPPRHIINQRTLRSHPSVISTADKKPKRRYLKPAQDQLPPPEPQPTRLEICNLRLHTLTLLSSLLLSGRPHPHTHSDPPAHGLSIIISHPNAVARLVRSLYDEVSLLSANLPTHNLHVKLVNTTTSLLHHILLSPLATDPKGSFELQRALSGVLVGVHNFRVAMTRVAFREEKPDGQNREENISEESMIKATEILEEYVTPDEARQLVKALGPVEVEDEDMDDIGGRGQDEGAMDEDVDEEAEMAEADVMAGIEQ